jgi:FixJ family two-component response regulator
MGNATTYLIAVVDDDTRILDALEGLLESAGYTSLVFPSAKAFLASGALARINCLITDLSMPDMDGFELEREARAVRPELPVIWITGRQSPAHRKLRNYAQKGVTVFFKPFDVSDLLDAVAAAVQLGGS